MKLTEVRGTIKIKLIRAEEGGEAAPLLWN